MASNYIYTVYMCKMGIKGIGVSGWGPLHLQIFTLKP